jgi:hypothetical protein
MLPPHRALLAAASLAIAACSAPPPPTVPAAAPARPAASAAEGPTAPPGHLLRGEVDRVLVTQGPPWVLRRVISEEVIRNDGKFGGWRLVGLPEEWRGIDVKPGDVVTRVNGLPLENPDEAWEAWKSVGKSADLKLDIVRDGAARQIVIPIDGAPSAETAKALGRDPGPQRPGNPAQNPRGSIVLGGGTPEPPGNDDAY